MTNEEFQKAVIAKLEEGDRNQKATLIKIGAIEGLIGKMEGQIGKMEGQIGKMEGQIGKMEGQIGKMEGQIGKMEGQIGKMEGRIGKMEGRIGKMEEKINTVEKEISVMNIRQDEMYQVLKAVEHSNEVGKVELDSHNIRIAKIEGKLKKVAKACNE